MEDAAAEGDSMSTGGSFARRGGARPRAYACGDAEATIDLPPEAPALPRIWIHVERPASKGPASLVLEHGESVVIGSGEAAELRLSDRAVSMRHARVEHVGHRIEIRDLGSRNGLRVDGLRVSHASITAPAAIEVGRSTLQIVMAAPPPRIDEPPLAGLIGASRPMRALAYAVRRTARLRLPVLIRGESGSGKELVARALHDEGPRADRPFVALNAAAIARELAESELFGHLKGAFTGALRDRQGAFREADGGTLFLDEIAALPLDLQAKLLRVVEEGLVRPLGAHSSFRVNVRLVVATCEPIERMVEERRFRGDLYERLAACVVHVPPLRDRREDLPALAQFLLRTSDLPNVELSSGAMAVLASQPFAGNVRELRNVLVQAALRSGARVDAHHVSAVLSERGAATRRRMLPDEAQRIFEEEGRNLSAAARRADLPRSTFRGLLQAHARAA